MSIALFETAHKMLYTTAASVDNIVKPGDTNTIVIAVTDGLGNPITGLNKTNFNVKNNLSGMSCLISGFANGINAGIYYLFVIPESLNWQRGLHDFYVYARNGDTEARCECQVCMY